MTEIALRAPQAPRRRLFQLLALAAGSALVAAGVTVWRLPALVLPLGHSAAEPQVYVHPRPHEPLQLTRLPRDAAGDAARRAAAARAAARVLASQAALDAPLAADAARAFDRSLYVSGPGAAATAAQVAAWRPLVDRAVRGTSIDANLLEAMVFVESGGNSSVIAGHDPSAPVGLTQLSAAQAASLHLSFHLGASKRLTRLIWLAFREGKPTKASRLEARRRVRDARFAPLGSLRGTVRYLEQASHVLGRTDLAVASYHLGVANLDAATAGEPVPFASLYFGSSPDRNAAIWRRLTDRGQVASDYYWKVLAAERVMRLYRANSGALAYEARLQARKNSSEEVMHPRSATPRFHSPRDLVRAWKTHELRAIPRNATVTHIAIGPYFAQMAHRLGRSQRLYRGLRPGARDVLLFIGTRVQQLSHARRPLILTSAVRDEKYQRLLMNVNANAARTYSIHTTGYAFDIARTYSSPRQAAAFQYVLDRLVALHAIAYIREAAAVHIAVASGVSLDVLRRAV
ncbi:MAG: hypothetical protein QOK22_2311 [Gaiellaceae bacterium]|jgi:hypothetical protein|nr:hypothetical protein [Gaiellaceae bacterium]